MWFKAFPSRLQASPFSPALTDFFHRIPVTRTVHGSPGHKLLMLPNVCYFAGFCEFLCCSGHLYRVFVSQGHRLNISASGCLTKSSIVKSIFAEWGWKPPPRVLTGIWVILENILTWLWKSPAMTEQHGGWGYSILLSTDQHQYSELLFPVIPRCQGPGSETQMPALWECLLS